MNKPDYVVFLHYHLRGGGVTRVIEQAVRALEKNGVQTSVIVGEHPGETDLDNVLVHPQLAYGETMKHSAKDLKTEIIELCQSKTGKTPNIWHIHNHHIGKNITMPLLARELSENGYSLILQIHDFPEDGRPHNYEYLTRHLHSNDPGYYFYPLGKNVHYVTLNHRDRNFLIQSGMNEERVSVIPNTIQVPQSQTSTSTAKDPKKITKGKPLILYPTRAIRRKNIGEFLLFSVLSDNNYCFAITLSPKNPDERVFYDKWVDFTRLNDLSMEFELTLTSHVSYPELLKASRLIMTTSITEGFGLTFLEPWLMNKTLFGRNIPDITRDFVDEGIDLSNLYHNLNIPLDWLDRNQLLQKMELGLKRIYNAYQKKYEARYVRTAFNAAVNNGFIDFGRLDEEDQRKIISQILKEKSKKKIISKILPPITEVTESVIETNKKLIKKKYNLQVYARRLLDIYDRSINSKMESQQSFLPASKVLNQFLKPERFILLRS